ncbi:hypothetical protein [Phyllobacterium sp. K27]
MGDRLPTGNLSRFAEYVDAFAGDRSLAAYGAFLPMGILFGAVHAMTPGHSKTIHATYLPGSSASMDRGLLTSIALSFTHVHLDGAACGTVPATRASCSVASRFA